MVEKSNFHVKHEHLDYTIEGEEHINDKNSAPIEIYCIWCLLEQSF